MMKYNVRLLIVIIVSVSFFVGLKMVEAQTTPVCEVKTVGMYGISFPLYALFCGNIKISGDAIYLPWFQVISNRVVWYQKRMTGSRACGMTEAPPCFSFAVGLFSRDLNGVGNIVPLSVEINGDTWQFSYYSNYNSNGRIVWRKIEPSPGSVIRRTVWENNCTDGNSLRAITAASRQEYGVTNFRITGNIATWSINQADLLGIMPSEFNCTAIGVTYNCTTALNNCAPPPSLSAPTPTPAPAPASVPTPAPPPPLPLPNRPPVAQAGVRIDGKTESILIRPDLVFSQRIIVTKGQPVTLWLRARGIYESGGFFQSDDPDGWTEITRGVQNGGKCEWNVDFVRTSPTPFQRTYFNPGPNECHNASLAGFGGVGPLSKTFNDSPGVYTYPVLRITDKQGAVSNIATIQVEVVEPIAPPMVPPPPPVSPPLPSPPLLPTVDIKVNGLDGPIQIFSGASVILTWTSSNAQSCTALGGATGWSGGKPTAGSLPINNITIPQTYILQCTSLAGSRTDSASVIVVPRLPSCALTATPSQVLEGGKTTLKWSCDNYSIVSSCSVSPSLGVNIKKDGGSHSISLNKTTTYSLTCLNNQGEASVPSTVKVTVSGITIEEPLPD